MHDIKDEQANDVHVKTASLLPIRTTQSARNYQHFEIRNSSVAGELKKKIAQERRM